MSRLKKLLIACIVIVCMPIVTLIYLYFANGYHGDSYTEVTNNATMELPITANSDEISENARNLVGTLYDPLKGGIGNIGGEMGFIVCIDVPRIAYGQAGIEFASLMKKDYEEHPELYDTEGGINTPDTPYFYRRVRNFYSFAEGNDLLIKNANEPQVGDIVFYGKYHATLVVGVHDDGTYDEVEAHPKLIFVKEHKHKKWEPHDVARFIN